MTTSEILSKIQCGETSRVQFKLRFTSQKQIAEEMVAFANCDGGDIIFGVEDKTGVVVGLDYSEIRRITQELGNTANEHVRPTIYIRTDIIDIDSKNILVATVLPGRSKPYKDLSGTIWVKQGADKRRVTENSEILSLFQESGEYHPDEAGVPDTSEKDIDTLALDRFFERVYKKNISEFDIPQEQLLRSIHITDTNGWLTTAGLMYFGQRPQQFKPSFVIKAVWFYGNSIAGTQYRDSRDIDGTIPEMYEQAMMWLKSCLRRIQNGQSFNSVGELEIPELVLEELLQNALVHIDLLKTAAIRLLVFDDRIEIINPGCVMGGHTVDEVKLGNSYTRNPLMANFCSKTMPYRGLGSGIPRVLAEQCHVEFKDSKEGNQFTAIVWRNSIVNASGYNIEINGVEKDIIQRVGEEFGGAEDKKTTQKTKKTTQKTTEKDIKTTQKTEKTIQKTTMNDRKTMEKNAKATQKTTEKNIKTTEKNTRTTQKTTEKILETIKGNPSASRAILAEVCGISQDGIKWQLKKLQDQGIIRRVGPDKGGHWEVIQNN